MSLSVITTIICGGRIPSLLGNVKQMAEKIKCGCGLVTFAAPWLAVIEMKITEEIPSWSFSQFHMKRGEFLWNEITETKCQGREKYILLSKVTHILKDLVFEAKSHDVDRKL